MGLSSDMRNLSEEILASFKQRITENEELVSEVQKTLDGFHKDHMEMAAALNANALALRKDLANGEKERMNNYNGLMGEVHHTIASIQKEVMEIQMSAFNLINEFAADRTQMANELTKFFTEGKADRIENEKNRMGEFDTLMKNINNDIKNINDEVMAIFTQTNEMLTKFENEHVEMSKELKAELGKNLADRVKYTRTMLNGFQKRLLEISNENQKMAKDLRKDLAGGETERLKDYDGIMEGIHNAIGGIRNDVKESQKTTAEMLKDLTQNRDEASAEWSKMKNSMAQIRKTGSVKATKEVTKKVEKKIEAKTETAVDAIKAFPVKDEPIVATAPEEPKMTLDMKILNYINKHPKGVKISEMEEPLGESRMKLGFIAKALLDEGKVQKMDNVYFPIK